MKRKPTEAELARKAQNEVTLRDAIVEGYLETGKALDAQAIADRVKWSATKVRRVLDEAHGAPDGIHPFQDYRDTATNHGLRGGHYVWVYTPATWLLRDMVNKLRAETKAPRYVSAEIFEPVSFEGLAEYYIGGEDASRALDESEPDIKKLAVGEQMHMGGNCFIKRVQ